MKRGQISTEYLLIVGFVTFVVLAILGIAFIYTSAIKDNIKIKQVNDFANKLISSAESVFYSGEPSKIKIAGYIPEGVNEIQINGNNIIFNVTTNTGENIIIFTSNVVIEGTIQSSAGVKVIDLIAQDDRVVIS